MDMECYFNFNSLWTQVKSEHSPFEMVEKICSSGNDFDELLFSIRNSTFC